MTSSRQSVTSGVEFREISDDEAGQRIDNYLLSRLKGLPRSRIYRLLRKGEVRVNKGRVGPSYRLREADIVRIPPVRRDGPAVTSRPAAATRDFLLSRILYEDERLIVLDKPPGMAVHGGSGRSFGVIEAMRSARPDCRYLELVHRLDRDTSGCLMIARKRSYLRSLHEILRSGDIDKRYLALLQGSWQKGTIRLEDRIRTDKGREGERLARVHPDGKRAVSWFKPVEDFRVASLVEIALKTGRTHQIRVQATHAGHPLAGDDRYGDATFNQLTATSGLKRIFLHAHSLTFDDPVSGEPRSFSAPLPDDLRSVLDRIQSK